MKDSEKLRVLANWMDGEEYRRAHPMHDNESTEVQDDLRRIADSIEGTEHDKENPIHLP